MGVKSVMAKLGNHDIVHTRTVSIHTTDVKRNNLMGERYMILNPREATAVYAQNLMAP